MRVRGLTAVGLASALALAACSGGAKRSAAAPPPTTTAPAPRPAPGATFTFGVIGDYPYTPDQVPQFDRLVDAINAEAPDVVLHVGDVGAQPCTDAALNTSLAAINRLAMRSSTRRATTSGPTATRAGTTPSSAWPVSASCSSRPTSRSAAGPLR